MVVEIRDWCQNVGEYNTYNFCIWHFGLCVIVSKIERCRSSDPPYEIAINPWWRGGRGLLSLIALLYLVLDGVSLYGPIVLRNVSVLKQRYIHMIVCPVLAGYPNTHDISYTFDTYQMHLSIEYTS